jgi:hypothetical protein
MFLHGPWAFHIARIQAHVMWDWPHNTLYIYIQFWRVSTPIHIWWNWGWFIVGLPLLYNYNLWIYNPTVPVYLSWKMGHQMKIANIQPGLLLRYFGSWFAGMSWECFTQWSIEKLGFKEHTHMRILTTHECLLRMNHKLITLGLM